MEKISDEKEGQTRMGGQDQVKDAKRMGSIGMDESRCRKMYSLHWEHKSRDVLQG